MPVTRLLSDDGRWTNAATPLYSRIVNNISPFIQDRAYSPREVLLLIIEGARELANRESNTRPRAPQEAQPTDEPAVDVTD